MYHLPDVLLGNSLVAERPLDAAWAIADPQRPETGPLMVLRCLVGHDLGRRDFDTRWEQAMTVAPPESETVEWTWARVRMLTERGSLAEAIEEDRRPVSPQATALGRQLRALSTAGLQAALGRSAEAIRGLENAMAEAEEEGCSLLLPEVTAKMVILTAPSNPEAAIALFELFDWAAGSEIGHPREGYLRLLARAAVRAGARSSTGPRRPPPTLPGSLGRAVCSCWRPRPTWPRRSTCSREAGQRVPGSPPPARLGACGPPARSGDEAATRTSWGGAPVTDRSTSSSR